MTPDWLGSITVGQVVTSGTGYTGDAGSGTDYLPPWYALNIIIKAA